MRPKAGKHKSGGKGSKGKQVQREKRKDELSSDAKPVGEQTAIGPAVAGPSSEPKLITPDVDGVKTIGESKYARRHIRSNWEKYEIPEDDYDHGEPASAARGADLSTVLASNLVGGGQFRFVDEKHWEDEGEVTNQLFSLDLQDLAESLSCIPLHLRLGIPTNHLTEEAIKKFEEAAKVSEAVYRSRPSKSQTVEPEKVQHVHQKKQTVLAEECDRISEECVLQQKEPETGGRDLEEELNVLLKLNEPLPVSNSSGSKAETSGAPLYMRSFSETLNRTMANKLSAKDLPTQSLEDWLDSVLED